MRNADKVWGERDCSLEATYDEDGVQVSSALDARGRELPDPVPMAPPVGVVQGPSLVDTVRRLFQQEAFRARLASEGFDSPEEADDFDIEDDPLDPLTPYEAHFMPSTDELGSSAPAPETTSSDSPGMASKPSGEVKDAPDASREGDPVPPSSPPAGPPAGGRKNR